MNHQGALWKIMNSKETEHVNHFNFISGRGVTVSMWVSEGVASQRKIGALYQNKNNDYVGKRIDPHCHE